MKKKKFPTPVARFFLSPQVSVFISNWHSCLYRKIKIPLEKSREKKVNNLVRNRARVKPSQWVLITFNSWNGRKLYIVVVVVGELGERFLCSPRPYPCTLVRPNYSTFPIAIVCNRFVIPFIVIGSAFWNCRYLAVWVHNVRPGIDVERAKRGCLPLDAIDAGRAGDKGGYESRPSAERNNRRIRGWQGGREAPSKKLRGFKLKIECQQTS